MSEIRDSIHGFIQRSELEERIIDTNIFQRLRRIKQLAMAYLVYPGAMHTRFEHSLGVMHIAGRLSERLLLDDEKLRVIVRLAALLHDIGHGPFSHVSECVLDKYVEGAKLEIKEKIHEKLTCEIILHNPELAEIIEDKDRERVVEILDGSSTDQLAKNIVSGPLDADKQDYLLRDSYYCGVKYGIFDIERLMETLTFINNNEEKYLAISHDGIYTLEQYILAKYHMTTQVYRHKVRLVTDAMIVRAIELGLNEDKIDWLIKLYNYDQSANYMKNYLEWDDNRLICSLLYNENESFYATKIFRQLHERKLFKRVFSKSLREFRDPLLRDFLSKINENKRKNEMESHLADNISSIMKSGYIDSNSLIIHSFNIKSVRIQSRDNEKEPIMICDCAGPKSFEDVSTLFRSINAEENDFFIEVYAPIKYSDINEKRELIARCESLIHEFFSNDCISYE